jgi:hypothetical protein
MSKFQRFFVSSKCVEAPICGTTFNMYPNRIVSLGSVDSLSGDVLKAIRVLFDKQDNRTSVGKRQTDGSGFEAEEIISAGVEPPIIAAMDARKDKAIETLVQAICSRKSQIALGTLLMDSLRDEFPYKRVRPVAEVEAWLYGDESGEYQGLEVPQMAGLIKGWVAANAEQFGDVGKQMAAEFLSLGRKAEVQVDAAAPKDSGEQSSEE